MKIEVLYPEICNLYGDLGNIRYLQKSRPELEDVYKRQRCALGGSTVRLDIGRDPLEYIKKCPRLGGQERGFSKAM